MSQMSFALDPRVVDPDGVARDRVIDLIRIDGRTHHGHVSPNRVRARLADETGIPSHVIGQAYRVLRLAGELVCDVMEISDDVRGGNAGKPHFTYAWQEVPS